MLEHLEKGIKFDQTIVAIIKNTSEKKFYVHEVSEKIWPSPVKYPNRIGQFKGFGFFTDTIWIVGPHGHATTLLPFDVNPLTGP